MVEEVIAPFVEVVQLHDPQTVPTQTVSLTNPSPAGLVQERETVELVAAVTARPVGATGTDPTV